MKITSDILYVGVNDHKVDLFEGQYKVPNGMCYNSYLILDEKVAVMDTVDQNFTQPMNGWTIWRMRSLAASPIISSSSTWSRTIPPTSTAS